MAFPPVPAGKPYWTGLHAGNVPLEITVADGATEDDAVALVYPASVVVAAAWLWEAIMGPSDAVTAKGWGVFVRAAPMAAGTKTRDNKRPAATDILYTERS